MLNTPQDYDGEPPPVLSNDASAGAVDVMDQKHKENLSHQQDHHDLNDSTDLLDSEVKDGKPQQH